MKIEALPIFEIKIRATREEVLNMIDGLARIYQEHTALLVHPDPPSLALMELQAELKEVLYQN